MNIIIVHVKRTGVSVPKEQLFIVDRNHVLGNPFTHLPLHKTKARYQVATVEEAISCYRGWLIDKVREQVTAPREIAIELRCIYNAMLALNKVNLPAYLACWCMDEIDPKSSDHGCHCQVLRDVFLRKYKTTQCN